MLKPPACRGGALYSFDRLTLRGTSHEVGLLEHAWRRKRGGVPRDDLIRRAHDGVATDHRQYELGCSPEPMSVAYLLSALLG